MNKPFLRIVLSILPCSISFAGLLPFSGPDAWITKKGDVLFEEKFSEPVLDTNQWTVAKGTWKIKDGVLTGSELTSDHHAAAIRANIPFTNAILQFDFKLDGSKGFSLSVNKAKSHHSRISISPDGISLAKDRDKKDARSLTLLLARQNCAFKPGVWYTIVVEYCGNDLLAHINKQTFVLGTHEQMGAPKINFGFPVLGESASFDNITVWAAAPSADAASIREKLLAQQAERRNDSPSDPRIACMEAETLLRDKLMKSDPAFSKLVDDRIAIDNEMHKRWPKAFLTNEAAQDLRKKLLAEDESFKALNSSLTKARQAEMNYLLKNDPQFAKLRAAMLKALQAK
jgi:hypothetical protein